MHQMKSVLIAMLGLALLPLIAACGVPAALDRPEQASAYLIGNVAVLDPDESALSAPQDVLVIGGAIEAMGDLAGHAMPEGVQMIDGTGLVLMPGLMDMHVHIFDEADLASSLAHGVTTVRNLAGMPFHLPMAQRIADGRLAGPRLITTGAILNERGGRNTNPLQTLISGPDEARRAVRRQYAQGYRHLKLYSNVSRESFAAILEEAARLGMTVSGHPVEGTEADPMPIDDTLAAGFASIEHAESIIWHALNDDIDPERMRGLAADIARAGATITPTLIVHANLARIVETRGAHIERADMAGFNPVIFDSQRGEYAYWASRETSDRPRMQAAYETFTGMLYDAGVPLLLGSDAGVMATPHGVSAIEELEALVRAGLTPAAALRTGTVNAAAVLAPEIRAGRIEPGFAADLVLLGADPREDFQILRRPVGVMANGYWYDEAALEALRDASQRPEVCRTRLRMRRHFLAR
ncbi:MAG: amidohydrolase family protein [Oceanicaulis sp.]|nr:amidohydrolase family protein [Oceanicaulis sp.]